MGLDLPGRLLPVLQVGGPSGPLEPILLRTRAARRDVLAWKRGETTASAGEIMAFNGITAEAMADRAKALLG